MTSFWKLQSYYKNRSSVVGLEDKKLFPRCVCAVCEWRSPTPQCHEVDTLRCLILFVLNWGTSSYHNPIALMVECPGAVFPKDTFNKMVSMVLHGVCTLQPMDSTVWKCCAHKTPWSDSMFSPTRCHHTIICLEGHKQAICFLFYPYFRNTLLMHTCSLKYGMWWHEVPLFTQVRESNITCTSMQWW